MRGTGVARGIGRQFGGLPIVPGGQPTGRIGRQVGGEPVMPGGQPTGRIG